MFALDDDVVAKRIGKFLAAQRKRLGYTQEKVAELIGLEPLTVSRQETGWSTPSVVSLIKLAYVYQVDLGVLVGQTVLESRLSETAALQGIEKKFAALSDADKQMVLKLLDTLISRLLEG